MQKGKFFLLISLIVVLIPFLLPAQGKITTPKEHLGFSVGDDYLLANYSQLVSYWNKLARESDRISLHEVGKSAEGRTMIMAVITSPENQKMLDEYKSTARRLALAEGLTDEEARELASKGKAVVWIDGGLHGTEVLGAQQLIELVFQMASRSDRETLRILDDVILLTLCTNPDGMELVSNWYMREEEPTKRSTRGIPRLYQKYTGHDNNRDFYMSTQPETEASNNILYREWFPQIVYNHHQTGPAGTVLFAPPFRDPFNYCFDPLVPLGIDLVGAAMHNRFAVEGKPGATMREGARYSTWWNGGLRTTVYFHNIIGILTETIGNPTPMQIPFLLERQLPSGDLPYPIAPQTWHFRQSIEYAITANRAILDVASKHREDFLFNIYKMGKNSIERGSKDSWTICPNRISEVQAQIQKDKASTVGSGRSRGYPIKYYDMLHNPDTRDPRGYILPADQPDFLTATKFVNVLIKNGVFVHKATQSFEIGEKSYPSGSYIVKCAQAFRPHILTMFEPQNHPDDIPYPGGPPRPTYDNAGWTVAYQMGVEFDRILDSFDGPFEKIKGYASPPEGKVIKAQGASGYFLDHRINDGFIAINRLLSGKAKIFWLAEDYRAGGQTYPAGTIYIPATRSVTSQLKTMAQEIGLSFQGTKARPNVQAFRLRPPRIGLWDRYGGSSTSGWVRWILEQFEFPFEVVYAPTLDAGDLTGKFDVLIFVSGAIPRMRQEGSQQSRSSSPPDLENIPPEYRDRVGNITAEKTIPHLLKFMKNGGTVITIGSSTSLGAYAGLPFKNHLLEKQTDGSERPLSREKYFVPGSILQARVDNSHPLAHGLPEKVNFFFSNSPVFRLSPEAALKDMKSIAWFDSSKPLRSGWAWGQHYLEGGVTAVEAKIGQGKLFLFGPEITFRGQPHGTFKFLFNGIYYGPSKLERP